MELPGGGGVTPVPDALRSSPFKSVDRNLEYVANARTPIL